VHRVTTARPYDEHMTEPSDAVAIVSELIAWLVLPLAAVILAAGILRRVWAARYRSAKAVVVEAHHHTVTLRWFGEGGVVHEMVTALGGRTPAVGDARTGWVHPSRPESLRLDSPVHDGRALLTLGAIFGAVGTLAAAVSFLLPLFG
jgi:hypothetical protein